jgi:hypothetical protein
VKASVDSLERVTRYDPQLLDSPENLLCLEDHHENHHHACQDSLPRPSNPRPVHTTTIHSLRSAPLSSHHRRNRTSPPSKATQLSGRTTQLFRYFPGWRLVRNQRGDVGRDHRRGGGGEEEEEGEET